MAGSASSAVMSVHQRSYIASRVTLEIVIMLL